MSGEGATLAGALGNLHAAQDGGAWDRRPGDLEATRGLGPVVAVGKRVGEQWGVALLQGGLELCWLPAIAAVDLGASLIQLGEICRDGWRE